MDDCRVKTDSVPLKVDNFAENILKEDIFLYGLSPGTLLRLGKDVVGGVPQSGEECHQNCAIRKFVRLRKIASYREKEILLKYCGVAQSGPEVSRDRKRAVPFAAKKETAGSGFPRGGGYSRHNGM